MAENPFLKESPLPYQLPPFNRIKDSDYRPAFEAGMGEALRDIAAIAHNPKTPDFENTLVALERSGQLLQRVSTVFDHLNRCNMRYRGGLALSQWRSRPLHIQLQSIEPVGRLRRLRYKAVDVR